MKRLGMTDFFVYCCARYCHRQRDVSFARPVEFANGERLRKGSK
jgi:hypothetical protein